MKKIILSALAISAFGIARAQESAAATKPASSAVFGIKAGLNVATITGDVEDVDAKAGVHIGFFADFKVSQRLSIQPEALYSTQGGKSSGTIYEDGVLYDVKEDLRLNYINVPILFKYHAQPRFNFFAGPQFGCLISAKDKIKVSDGLQSGSDTVDVKDAFQTIDLGVILGVGYDFTKEFFGEARYVAGLSNISDTTTGDKMHNAVFQISLGYRFNK